MGCQPHLPVPSGVGQPTQSALKMRRLYSISSAYRACRWQFSLCSISRKIRMRVRLITAGRIGSHGEVSATSNRNKDSGESRSGNLQRSRSSRGSSPTTPAAYPPGGGDLTTNREYDAINLNFRTDNRHHAQMSEQTAPPYQHLHRRARPKNLTQLINTQTSRGGTCRHHSACNRGSMVISSNVTRPAPQSDPRG